MTTHRRRVLSGGTVLLLSGCSGGHRSSDGSEEEKTTNSAPHSGDSDNDTSTQRQFVLEAMFVNSDTIAEGFEILPSDHHLIDGLKLYADLLEAIETIPKDERTEGSIVESCVATFNSDEGKAVSDAIEAIRREMEADSHPNDESVSRRGTHYIEHDGAILRVSIYDLGRAE